MDAFAERPLRLRLYYPVTAALGLVLLIASALKFRQFDLGESGLPAWARGLQRELVVAEVLAGVWLLTGLSPAWSRRGALLLFATFFNVSLVQYLDGRSSCGCLGLVTVQPLVIAGFDAVAILALAWIIPPLPAEPLRLVRRGAVVAVGAMCVAWAMTGRLGITTAAIAAADPQAAEAGQVYRDTALPAIAAAEARVLSSTIETEDTFGGPKGTPASAAYHLTRRYVTVGPQVRRDTFRQGAKGSELLDTFVLNGKRLTQYDPVGKRAWIRATDDREFAIPLDFKTIALRPPVGRISDWLKASSFQGAEVTGVSPTREIRAVVTEPALDTSPAGFRVELVLDERHQFLPTRVTYRATRDGGIRSIVALTYDPVKVALPVPATVGIEYFNSAAELTATLSVKVTSCVINQPIPEADFDPVLAPKTLLGGNLSSSSRVGDAPAPASRVSTEEPISREPLRPRGSGPMSRLGTLAAANALVTVIALVPFVRFRRRTDVPV